MSPFPLKLAIWRSRMVFFSDRNLNLMRKLHVLSLCPPGPQYLSGAVEATVGHLLQGNQKYILTTDFGDCDICLIVMPCNISMDNTLLNNYFKYDGDPEELRNNDKMWEHLCKFMGHNLDKRFFTYRRHDYADVAYVGHASRLLDNCANYVSTIKDYISDYTDNLGFLFRAYALLEQNPTLEKLIGTPGDCLKSRWGSEAATQGAYGSETCRMAMSEVLKEKYDVFTFNFEQYGPFLLWEAGVGAPAAGTPLAGLTEKSGRYSERLCAPSSEAKLHDVFYCKHQRSTPDGVARRYVHEVVMPSLARKFSVEHFESLPRESYYVYVEQAKILISCWGLGERVEDDDISNYYNTIVIKPHPGYDIYDYFNTFTDRPFNETHRAHAVNLRPCIVFCKSDFSDIEEVVSRILDNYDFYLEKVKYRNEQLLQFVQSNQVKDDFVRILDRCEK
jgi:hypothetical protein